jgi:hypothetical protein
MKYIISILLLAVLFSGCTILPTGYSVVELKDTQSIESEGSELLGYNPVEFEEQNITEDKLLVPEFRDVDFSYLGTKIIIEGYLYADDEPLNDIAVEIFCDNEKVAEAKTDALGKAYFPVSKECDAGDKAWLEITYDGKSYKSDKMIIPDLFEGDGDVSGDEKSFSVQSFGTASHEIPEFSTITAGIALVGAAAYYFRKRKH